MDGLIALLERLGSALHLAFVLMAAVLLTLVTVVLYHAMPSWMLTLTTAALLAAAWWCWLRHTQRQ